MQRIGRCSAGEESVRHPGTRPLTLFANAS